jgi:hypothetical protein
MPEASGFFHGAGARCKPDDENRDHYGQSNVQRFRRQMLQARREPEEWIWSIAEVAQARFLSRGWNPSAAWQMPESSIAHG